MKLSTFIQVVDEVLSERGFPVSIHDLPDQDFYEYFDEDYDEDEARDAANELIDTMIYDGELPTFE